jgi:hypothetical protein
MRKLHGSESPDMPDMEAPAWGNARYRRGPVWDVAGAA